MKFRLPITEKFLWDLYYASLALDDVASFISQPSLKFLTTTQFDPIQKRYRRLLGKKRFTVLLYYLKKQGYIETPEWQYKTGLFLSPRGLKRAILIDDRVKIKTKKKRVDGRWAMVIFDIPENKKAIRDTFRNALRKIGYRLLQKSIWVCPYDVLKHSEEIIRKYDLEDEVKLLLIEEIKVSIKPN